MRVRRRSSPADFAGTPRRHLLRIGASLWLCFDAPEVHAQRAPALKAFRPLASAQTLHADAQPVAKSTTQQLEKRGSAG